MWPAMWGNAFYDDDAENGPLANKWGLLWELLIMSLWL